MNPSRGQLLKPSERNSLPTTADKGERRPSAKLSEPERKKFQKLEAVIETPGLAVSYALRTIRDEKLYRQSFQTFEDYCQQRWGFTRQRAYQLLSALDVVESLPKQMSTIVDTEGQARALAKIPPESREKALAKASENGKVTAKAITEAAKKITTPKPEKHFDKTGYPIPENIWEDWQRAEAFGEALREISRIKSLVSNGLEEGDVIYRELNQGAVSMLKNIYGELKCVIPYAVCSSCQGRLPGKCVLCKGRGFLSDFAWHQFVSAETREMRAKVGTKR